MTSRHMRSPVPVVDLKGNVSALTIHILGVMEGAESAHPPALQEAAKKPV